MSPDASLMVKCLACMHVRLHSHAHDYKGPPRWGPGPQCSAIGQRPALVYLGITHGGVGQGAVNLSQPLHLARESWRVHACIDAHGRGMKRSGVIRREVLTRRGTLRACIVGRGVQCVQLHSSLIPALQTQ